MKLDKKILQLVKYGAKAISISKENYNNLEIETKKILKYNNIKIYFDETQKNFCLVKK